VVKDTLGWRCPFIGVGGGRQATLVAGIRGEMGGGVNGDLSALKLRFRGGNGCSLMVEGGGSHGGGAGREAAGLCLVARPEEDEGGRGPAVRERRGHWAGGLGSGEVVWAAWAAGGPRPEKWAGQLG
jgi:hypothetical protein